MSSAVDLAKENDSSSKSLMLSAAFLIFSGDETDNVLKDA